MEPNTKPQEPEPVEKPVDRDEGDDDLGMALDTNLPVRLADPCEEGEVINVHQG